MEPFSHLIYEKSKREAQLIDNAGSIGWPYWEGNSNLHSYQRHKLSGDVI